MDQSNFIEITESAFRRAGELSNGSGSALRIAVDGGGCAGFTYNYEMTKDVAEDDLVFEEGRAKVIIDKASAEYLYGSKVDFIEELGGRYFSIKNPKATSKCGCGNSFGM
ncbi:MAG: iron-sulfur cluster assembly accessory protein [Pseudomonadota bacterium]